MSKSFICNSIRLYKKVPESLINLDDIPFKNKIKTILIKKGYYTIKDALIDSQPQFKAIVHPKRIKKNITTGEDKGMMVESSRRKDDVSSDEDLEDDYEVSPRTWSRQILKSAAIQLRLLRPRSLAWAVLLEALPSPVVPLLPRLKQHRENYEQLRSKFTKDPRTVVGDDPLSQKDESVWKQHFCDNELKALILQDVVRTFPEEPYFREKDVQDLMVRVLFVWARSHQVGYRQGMHEVLAPLLYERHSDTRHAPHILSDTLQEVLKPEFLEHDSYMLFSALMKGLERFYTTGTSVPTASGRLPPSTTLHNPNEVVRYLERVREEQLVPLDPQLASHLAACNISLELFGIRWLRLLFGREFPRSEIPGLWGFLFAEGPSLPHLHYVVVATLISMRGTLLEADPGVVLSALMRPAGLSAAYVAAFALHLREPLVHRRPAPPPAPPAASAATPAPPARHRPLNGDRPGGGAPPRDLEEAGGGGGDDDSDEGVAEGADVARELATLALVRAQLPRAAAALAHALPARPSTAVAQPLSQILQLSALLQCRHHALVDVETALEAAEGQPPAAPPARRRLVPVQPPPPARRLPRQPREVPLTVFHRVERAGGAGGTGDLPCLDPLRLRTE